MGILAQELRIGNIFWENYGGYKQVVGINHSQHEGHVVQATGIGYKAVGAYSLKDCYPIPLSPEVLEKCGLKERYAKGEWSWAECSPYHHWTGYTEIRQRDHGFQYLTEQYPLIKYLHQLQNLYFALTGTELTYNPNQP